MLAETFLKLADTLVADFDTLDFLHLLAERTAALLEVDAVGLLVTDQRGQLRLVAASTERTRLLELFQLQAEEGPCLDCFNSGQSVECAELEGEDVPWPRFAAEAVSAGFHAVTALPMRLRSDVVGAMNLFRYASGTLGGDDVRVAQGLADIATIGLLHERAVREQEILSEQLQTALNSRVLIEQAKGVIAERRGCDMEEAFAALRTYARGHGRALSAVALEVVQRAPGVLELTSRRDPE